MIVTILYRMAGCPEVEGSLPFTDVEADEWYSDAILWGYKNDIVRGVRADLFAPHRDVTREQMVTFFYRYAKYAGADLTATEDLSVFDDCGTISDYAVEPMTWAVAEGIVTGVTNQLLQPQGTATRAQAATVIMRFDSMMK
jgi:hypothetical protein